uniref:Uncharacterized protein n=1 Tax=Biomphalaria glabrata TaxID=6526 RepID=A0A2C9LTU7_BIOGL
MKETRSSEESPSDVFNQEKLVAKYLEVEPTICPQEFTPVPENYPLGFANRAFPDTIADTKRSPGLQVTRSLEMNNFKAMERFIFVDIASCPLFFKNFRGLFMDKTFVFGLTKPCCSIKFTKYAINNSSSLIDVRFMDFAHESIVTIISYNNIKMSHRLK